MIYFRSRLIIGLIRKIITGILKFIYAIICAFNLQLALLVSLIGLVVYLVGGFEGGGMILTVFIVLLVASIFYAVYGTVKRLLGVENKTKKKRGNAQIVNQPIQQAQTTLDNQAPSAETATQPPVTQPITYNVEPERPTYYRVKQNPNYVMAEYSDRYELYAMQGGKMIKIRTDFK